MPRVLTEPERTGCADVCLLSMPYPCLDQPSVALGLLKAALSDARISAKAMYACLWFAEEIGLDVYNLIYDSKQEFLAGEWTFASAAFPDFQPDEGAYLDLVCSAAVSRGLVKRSGFGGSLKDALLRTRDAAPSFVSRVAHRVLDLNPKIVGCTSTFMQHCASLALLRKIRELAPDVVTMIGGANCEGNMGVATRRCFPWVDFVVSGEADLLISDLCRKALARGRAIPKAELPYGVISKESGRVAGGEAPRASVNAMDRIPVPDFDDYFAELAACPAGRFISPGLAFETSRGCWWGKVHHCTFCGLNGGNMEFRSKSPDRVLAELDTLAGRYGIRKFNIVDNILDLGYIRTLLPRLAERGGYSLFFETKANLKREQIAALARAGIRRLQPGIESLHDGVLGLIDKGTTGLLNVRFLKWAREMGVFAGWNFLWDVPGEKDEWYREIAAFLPSIYHLQPPGVDRIQFHRFSPYHQRPASFGLRLEPFPHYSSVYPASRADLSDLAYYFEAAGRPPAKAALDERPHLREVMRLIAQWGMLWERHRERGDDPPLLLAREVPGGICLDDTRPCSACASHYLEGPEADIYRALADIHTVHGLGALVERGRRPLSMEAIERILRSLEERNLILGTRGQFLALGLTEVRPLPDSADETPAGYTDLTGWIAANRGQPAFGG